MHTRPSALLSAAVSIAAVSMRTAPRLLGRLAAARLRQTGLSPRCPCCLGTQTGTGSWQRCCCLGDTDLCAPNATSETDCSAELDCCCPGNAREERAEFMGSKCMTKGRMCSQIHCSTPFNIRVSVGITWNLNMGLVSCMRYVTPCGK